MKTKKLLTPFIFSMLLVGVALLSAAEFNTPTERKEDSKVSQKARYTFSLQLFQIF
ncbi:MAG: hypothetical protein ACI9DK_001607 [Vicingaceae bacterium]|jgi:hypothetical protein